MPCGNRNQETTAIPFGVPSESLPKRFEDEHVTPQGKFKVPERPRIAGYHAEFLRNEGDSPSAGTGRDGNAGDSPLNRGLQRFAERSPLFSALSGSRSDRPCWCQ